ncbi:MAG TPA: FAD-binding oxidoreductase [Dongiaceae bacterium]|nr:FAD-binding oxidoreductase [Dongiaceae bacterium]
MSIEQLVAQLAQIVGLTNVLVDPADMLPFSKGARGEQGKAAFVVCPATTREVASVVRLLRALDIGFVVQGANTGLVAGSVPDMTGEQGVVSLRRLTGDIIVDPLNRSCTVGAGVRLSALNEVLAGYDCCFPIDLGSDPSIGGMIATNTGGARFIRYGDVRDHVLGLEVVLLDRDGTVLDLMNALRKNNVGLETVQLFIGTAGRYGIVTKAVLDVSRRPGEVAAAIVVPRDDAAVTEILLAVEGRFGNELAAFEGMSRNALACALKHVPNVRNPFAPGDIPPYALLIEVSRPGGAANGISLDAQLQEYLGGLLERDDPPVSDAFFGSPHELWALRHALHSGLLASGRVMAFDLAFQRGRVLEFRNDVRALMERVHPHLVLCDFGHIGDGGIHCNFLEPWHAETTLSVEQIADLRSMVMERAVRGHRGSFSGEHSIGRANVAFYDRFVDLNSRRIADGIDAVIRDLT